ncbi:hypothetical protein BJP41_06330 [Candidatus Williamhamiltonella defendens]|uniref:Uncharacterized protein n=1 Tax=Candidatus Williamhamiltonella defendens TaxID=138072 RepID=A0A2D3T2G3_9ENTR|nr:hypothetical protein [Candidatus Hamiltonella defensa]ASV34060.1 hypothetical protein CJJ18_08835 [Candidatus Hamiltonella defensa]ATW30008.1 hypothetical protein BJP41_06330 [Candidatus Hamiltonella defensa]ATW31982.1 hypothetical protein BJP42_06425 [Candidatus Hamiltonella defensa]AWK17015.1 hypothetical protein CCS40_08650 [Candidatus Hamiltonella defensa]MBK4362294.1 hypothetical protein [Candidatus Hamiltonella defensa]
MSSTNVPSSIEMILKPHKKYEDDVKKINKEFNDKREIIFSKLNPDGSNWREILNESAKNWENRNIEEENARKERDDERDRIEKNLQDDRDRRSEMTHKKLMERLSQLIKDAAQDKNSIKSTTDSDDRKQTHDKESLKKSDSPLESQKIKDLKAKNENEPLSKEREEREERKRESLVDFEINQLNEKNKAAIARVEKTADNIHQNQLYTDEAIKNVEKQHVDIDVAITNIGKQQSAIILYSAVAGFDGDKGTIPANSDLSSSTNPQQSSFLSFFNPLSWF